MRVARLLLALPVLLAAPASGGKKPPRVLLMVEANAREHPDKPRGVLVPLVCSSSPGQLAAGPTCAKAVPGKTAVALSDGTTAKTRGKGKVGVCLEFPGDQPVKTTGLRLASAPDDVLAAAWPAGEDLGLRAPAASKAPLPANAPRGDVTSMLSDDLDGDGKAELLVSLVRDPRPRPAAWVGLWIVPGDGAAPFLLDERRNGPGGLDVIATSDVDGDGKREIVVYAPWGNEYDVAVYEYGTADPVYAYECGNM